MADSTPDIAIKVDNYSLWYGDFQALFDVDMDIAHGEITSMIGPSGCGKSTMLRSINRINERFDYVRTQGSIHVLGHDITAPEVELVQVRRHIGMVFQRPNPLPLSIRENVLFGHKLHYGGPRLSRADEDNLVQQTLQTVLLWDQVKDRLNKPATGLSLEEQQKLCIARLLPVKPTVLLMDEPFGALDEIVRDRLNEQLLELWRATQKTVLFVTHSIPEAVFLSTKIAVMSPRPGRISKIIDNPLPADRPLDVRETTAFLDVAAEVRAALREGMDE